MFELFAGAESDISVWKLRGVIVCLGCVMVGRGAIGHGTYKHFLIIFGNFSEKKRLSFWGERFVFIGKNSRRWG